jgi:hypothetical protein
MFHSPLWDISTQSCIHLRPMHLFDFGFRLLIE